MCSFSRTRSHPLVASLGFAIGAAVIAAASGLAQVADAVRPSSEPRALAVEWRRDVWQPAEVRTMTLSGATSLTIAGNVLRGGNIRWSPDGSRIGGYHRETGPGQWDVSLMSVRADGTAERTVLSAAAFDAFNVARGMKPGRELGSGHPFGIASWSPTGDALVFDGVVRYEGPTADASDDRWRSRLFVVSSDGSMALSVVTDGDDERDDFDPHWSAALDRIVFVRSATALSGRVGQQELWTVRPDGSDPRMLTDLAATGIPSGTGVALGGPVWSPDGRRIAVTGGYEPGPTLNGDLWLIGVDAGAGLESVGILRAESGAAEWHPAWSPDGRSIVFANLKLKNTREERSRIVIRELETGTEQAPVDSTKQVALRPDWRPLTAP